MATTGYFTAFTKVAEAHEAATEALTEIREAVGAARRVVGETDGWLVRLHTQAGVLQDHAETLRSMLYHTANRGVAKTQMLQDQPRVVQRRGVEELQRAFESAVRPVVEAKLESVVAGVAEAVAKLPSSAAPRGTLLSVPVGASGTGAFVGGAGAGSLVATYVAARAVGAAFPNRGTIVLTVVGAALLVGAAANGVAALVNFMLIRDVIAKLVAAQEKLKEYQAALAATHSDSECGTNRHARTACGHCCGPNLTEDVSDDVAKRQVQGAGKELADMEKLLSQATSHTRRGPRS